MPRKQCTIDGCQSRSVARQMCNLHYVRWQRHGDPHYQSPRIPTGPLVDALREAASARGMSLRALMGSKTEVERLYRLSNTDTVCLFEADRICITALGLTVDEVYGQDIAC